MQGKKLAPKLKPPSLFKKMYILYFVREYFDQSVTTSVQLPIMIPSFLACISAFTEISTFHV